jgi:hypothetical protein
MMSDEFVPTDNLTSPSEIARVEDEGNPEPVTRLDFRTNEDLARNALVRKAVPDAPIQEEQV